MVAIVEPLRHGYTNRAVRDGDVVTKTYLGPDAAERCRREATVLWSLADLLPIPEVLGSDVEKLRTRLVHGTHGKDMIAGGLATPVLSACGGILKLLHAVDPRRVFGDDAAATSVVVHGDFGPNNILLDRTTMQVVAVVDWEWSHAGDPVEDLGWCEWIIRTFHSDCVDSMAAFFGTYGSKPPWTDRHAAMMTKLEQLHDFAEQRDPGGPVAITRVRQLDMTADWIE